MPDSAPAAASPSAAPRTGNLPQSRAQGDSLIGFDKAGDYAPEGPVDSGSTRTVDSACVVFIFPSSEQWGQIGREDDSLPSERIRDEMYQSRDAARIVDSLGIPSLKLEGKERYLRMVDAARSVSWLMDVRKPGAPYWNLVYFKPGKDPKIVAVGDPALDSRNDDILGYFR